MLCGRAQPAHKLHGLPIAAQIHLDSLQCFEHFLAITGRRNGASCSLDCTGGGDVQRCAEMCRDVQIESEKSIKSYQNDMKRTAGCATLAPPEVGCRYLCHAFAEWRREGANSFPYFSRSLAALVETNGKDAR